MKLNVFLFAILASLLVACGGESTSEATTDNNGDQNQATTFFKEGMVASDSVEFEKAIEFFTKAIEIDASMIEAYRARAELHMYFENYDKAITDWEVVVTHDTKDMEARFQLGLSFYNAKRYDKAISTLNAVLRTDSLNANAYYTRGLSLIESGDKDAGCDDLYRADSYGESEVYFNTLNERCLTEDQPDKSEIEG